MPRPKMGRKKMELKRIEDKSSRQVTFSKRRSGLMKKARELSVLCDVDLALLIFSNRGKLYEFSSGNNSLSNVLERYQRRFEEDKIACKGIDDAENHDSDYANSQSYSEILQVVRRCLDEPDIDQLCVTDLEELEKQLDAALTQTRDRKTQLVMQSVTNLHEQERMLREENELLEREIAAMKKRNAINETNEVRGFIINDANNNMIHQSTLDLLTVGFES